MPGAVGRSPAAPCALCGAQGGLQLSHLIPKFVFKHASQRSPTGYLRTTAVPNRRSQDGPKDYLLCSECEQRFSRWENSFAHVFKLNHDKPGQTFTYSSDDALAALSIVWRVLAMSREHREIQHLELGSDYSRTDDAFEAWKRVLLGQQENPGVFRLNWVWFNYVHPQDGVPEGINRYIFHASDFDVWASKSQSFVIAHIPGVFIIGATESFERSGFRGFDVSLRGGRYVATEGKVAPIWLKQYIEEKIAVRDAAIKQMTPAQKKKISDDVLKDPEKALKSSMFRSILADYGHQDG